MTTCMWSSHFDPIITSNEKVNDARHWLGELVKEIDPALSIHDLRMVAGPHPHQPDLRLRDPRGL